MSVLRSIGKIAGGVFFTTFLALAIFTGSIVKFTESDSLKPLATELIKSQYSSYVNEEQLNQIHAGLLEKCIGKESIDL